MALASLLVRRQCRSLDRIRDQPLELRGSVEDRLQLFRDLAGNDRRLYSPEVDEQLFAHLGGRTTLAGIRLKRTPDNGTQRTGRELQTTIRVLGLKAQRAVNQRVQAELRA